MIVITFTNPKGGSGKTTSAFLLAEQLALAGMITGLLDLDPNENLVAWQRNRERRGAKQAPFTVYSNVESDEISSKISELANELDYLIIDLEGTKNDKVTRSILRSNLCIIPLDGSPMEGRQAVQAIKLVAETSEFAKNPILYGLLFTRANAAFKTSDEKDYRRELESRNIPIIPTRIAKRAPFTRIFRDSVLLSELPQIVKTEQTGKSNSAQQKAYEQLSKAMNEAKAYAQNIVDFINLDNE